MDAIPVASFLAGALLSIFLPTLLLISIVVWSHIEVIRRTPDPPPPSRFPQGPSERQPASNQPPAGESRPSA